MARWLVVLLVGSGCATVFKGTRRDVAFFSHPTSTAVVMSGAAGSVLAKVHDLDEARALLLELLSPVVPSETRQTLEALSADQLLTMLFAVLQPARATNEAIDELGRLSAQLPPTARAMIADTIFVEDAGFTPLTVSLRKGREYAGVAWAPGRRAHLFVVRSHFDAVALLNVFTLGIGFLVDAITGAWFDLEPSIDWELAPLPSPASPQ